MGLEDGGWGVCPQEPGAAFRVERGWGLKGELSPLPPTCPVVMPSCIQAPAAAAAGGSRWGEGGTEGRRAARTGAILRNTLWLVCVIGTLG